MVSSFREALDDNDRRLDAIEAYFEQYGYIPMPPPAGDVLVGKTTVAPTTAALEPSAPTDAHAAAPSPRETTVPTRALTGIVVPLAHACTCVFVLVSVWLYFLCY